METRHRDIIQVLLAVDDVTPDQSPELFNRQAQLLGGLLFGILGFGQLYSRRFWVEHALFSGSTCILSGCLAATNRSENLDKCRKSLVDFGTRGGCRL